MDPLMNAMSKRMRGRIRFRKDVEAEQGRMQLARERLERAVGALMDGRLTRQARVSDEVSFVATVAVPGMAFLAAGRHAHHEVLAATTKVLTEKFVRLIAHGLLTGHFPETEFEPLR